jgi:hypothetical protein
MTTQLTKQSNLYVVYNSIGVRTNVYINASNIKEACQEAKKRIKEIGSLYYSVKRCYNGGVRG